VDATLGVICDITYTHPTGTPIPCIPLHIPTVVCLPDVHGE